MPLAGPSDPYPVRFSQPGAGSRLGQLVVQGTFGAFLRTDAAPTCRVFCLAAHRNAHAARSGGSCVLSGSLRAAASCAVDWRRNDSCPLCLWRSSHCCHSSRGRWAVDAGPPRYPRRRVDGLTSTQQRPGARSSTASNDRARTPSTMPATSAWFIRHNTSGRAWAAWRKGQLRSTM